VGVDGFGEHRVSPKKILLQQSFFNNPSSTILLQQSFFNIYKMDDKLNLQYLKEKKTLFGGVIPSLSH